MGEGSLKRRVASLLLAAAVAGCAGSSRPVPAPLPAVTPLVRTLDEARAMRDGGQLGPYQHALQTLSHSPDETTARRATALLGLFLGDQRRFGEAVPVLREAVARNAATAPFLRLRLSEALAGTGDVAGAVAALTEVLPTGSTAATVAKLRLPPLLARLGDRAGTDAAWQQAMQVPVDELSEPELLALADGLEANGRADLTSATRMHLLRDYTAGRYTEQLYAELTSEIEALSADEKLALATKLARADRYDQALALLENVARTTGAASPYDNPQYRGLRMRALFNSRNYGQLLDETKDVMLDDPSLILVRARAAWRDDRPADFLAMLSDVETRFPASREALEAKVARAKYFITDEIDYDRAITDLSAAVAAGAAGSDGENLWNLGWIDHLAGREQEALATFARYVATYPDGDWKTNSLFWSARILDRGGRAGERDANVQQLVTEYPYSYYSWRAKQLWPAAANAPLSAAGTQFPDVAGALAGVVDPRLDAVRELLAIELPRDAAREMKAVAGAWPDNPGIQFLLADVDLQGGEPFKANGVLQRQFRQFVRHGGSGIPRRFWEILFPLAYSDSIRQEAERRGLDPYLLAAIIRQESGFEPTTVSNAGAVGLMQIMPQEAGRIAAAAGLPEPTRDQLFDPATNIAIGAAEYAQKLALMNGNPVLAIAAYNAGEQAVGTWIEKTPVEDIDLFVESIPFAETRLYVKTVSRNRFEYRRIYESSRVTPAAAETSP